MINCHKIVKIVSLVFITVLFSCGSKSEIELTNLKCEYRTNPLGIDNSTPRFSWKLVTVNQTRGQQQTAYQILVANSLAALDENNGNVWDSRKQESNKSVNVVYAGKALKSCQHYFWKVRVWDISGKVTVWSQTSKFVMGLLNPEDWKGEWIYKEGQNKKDHNWYRKNFTLDEIPTSGLVNIASFGYHEIYVNGKKVGDGVMNPVYSFMKKRLPYLTYDIKEYLKKGNNVIGVWHAAGWARWGRIKEYYDAPFVFKAQATISVEEKQLMLISNTSWKCKKSYSSYFGPWDILNFGGEIIDERLREDDWNLIEYDDSNWENAVVFDQSSALEVDDANVNLGLKGAIKVPGTDANPPTSKITATLSSQMVEPQVKFKTVTPIKVEKNIDGTYLIDMGENYTGLFEMNLFNGKEGDTLTFEVADQLTTTSSYKQKSKYVYGKTGKGHFTNRFNLAGGRWVTVYGLNYLPELKDIKGHVITNNRKQISKFESSSKLLNTIYQTNLNTYIANTIDGILVDCPHRERRGWGEVTVAAMYGDALPNFESGAYMEQYAQFMQDAQANNGKMRAVINGDDFNFLMWMANSPISLWETYRMLGNKKLLSNQYASMVKWMNWLYKHSNYETGGALKIGTRGSLEFPGLGDWCTPRGNFWSASNSPESAHFNNCTYAFMLDCALNIAKTLDKKEDVKIYTNRLKVQRKATHRQSYNPVTGKYGEGHQVNQALALLAGVTPDSEKQKVYDNLVDQVLYKFPYYDTGSSGQGLYTRYFIEYGERMDLIYELLQDKHHPSYGYFIEQGKTVWPERWSAVGGSQIHTCYTGIGGYFIKGFGGIRPDPDKVGMQNMLLKPALVGDLTYANTKYESMYGNVVVNWTKTGEKATFHIEVPVNTSAKLYIPAVDKNNVKENNKLAEHSKGVTYIGSEKSDAVGNYVIFNIVSGSYNFKVNKLPIPVYPMPIKTSDNIALIGRMNGSTMFIVSDKLPGFEAFKANDENKETHWQANDTKNQYLEVEWVKPQTFNKLIVDEFRDHISEYKIQYWDNGTWKDIATGTNCGVNKEHTFNTITTSKCRVFILKAKDRPLISEMKIYNLNEVNHLN